MAQASVKRLTQKAFFAALAKRAKKYGFVFADGFAVRECKTGKCPVVAVANDFGVRAARCDHLTAASKMGLSTLFADSVADAADHESDLALRRRLIRACDLPA